MLIGDKIPEYREKPKKCRNCGKVRLCFTDITTEQPVCRECYDAVLQKIGDNLLADLDA
jgi:protein-arginine kinase activator protein McsA